jgi:DNA polymerase-3 subunit beta
MLIHVLQENLLKALSRTGRIVSARPQLPVAQHARLSVREEGLQVTTTNLETTESVWVGGKVGKEGALCVPSRLLSEYVASLPAETVQLAAKEGSLIVSCGSFRATIPGIAASEFPPVSEPQTKGGIKLNKEDFVQTLSRVLFAAATDEGRPLLTGVRIIGEGEETVFAATDGYRLSIVRVPRLGRDPLDLVVPARTLSEALKVAAEEKDAKEIVLLAAGDGQLALFAGDTHLSTRVIEGEYPPFAKIIPKAHTTRALLDMASFGRAVRAASIFARDSANIVRMKLEGQKIMVSANSPQVGENESIVDAKIDGEGGEIAFNSRFLIELLANTPYEEMLFEMTGSLNPGVFKPVKDASFLHIIMPVRVQE